ncbi:hypothetical protein [Polaribacter sp. HL-MS24]|uniref:hypothetical protein n=1 Tax=Polaribacter sp. HL-MS24 TaxID=3077735 RepID=UPI002934CB21|nr:hypothetical protein [Polaribacter sp. HL-MS24]WOC40099.1 hypothetical protein RRF69_10880 [Polaribacter sp. HL-MS24]
MELANIEKLLEKYLNAETSLQEEATLKSYFTEGPVAPHLQEYQSLFSYFTISKAESFSKPMRFTTQKPKGKRLRWFSIAASLALLVSVYASSEIYKQRKLEQQYAQISNALTLLSINLKKGENAIAKVQTYETTINKILK